MSDVEFLKNAIEKVLGKLNSRTLNYTVDVELYVLSHEVSPNINAAAKSAFGGNALIGGFVESSSSELFEEVMSGLSYAGDKGSHSNQGYVGTIEHKRDLENISNKIQPLLRSSKGLTSFWLKEGHPFYPVFWDFAFFIEGSIANYILIGSSSD